MTMRLLPLVVLLAACGPKKSTAVDPTLPEREIVTEARAPVDVLTEGADDDDPNLRARALGLLIRTTHEPAGGPWARRALFDPDPWVQRSGLDALVDRLDEPATVKVLEDFVRAGMSTTDPYVRGAAAMRLAEAGHMAVKDSISAAWRSEKLAWRAAPLQLAAAYMGDTEALKPLTHTLARGDLALETDFVLDIGRSGLTDLLAPMKEGSEWVEDELLLPYAVARVSLGDPSGEGALRKAITGPDEILQLEALDYLSRLKDPTADALLDKATGQGSELVRAYAELALVARGQRGIDQLERAVQSEDREVRALAVRFAAESGADADSRKTERLARRIVRDALVDPDPVVRTAALRGSTLVHLHGQDEGLVASLGDEYLAVRVEAAGAILLLAR